MATDPANWHQALACVTGAFVRGEQRITTHELLTVYLGVPVTDPSNGNVLRAQTTAAATAVNAQLRADETKMRQVQKADVMARLLEIMKVEQAKLLEMEPRLRKEEHPALPDKNASS